MSHLRRRSAAIVAAIVLCAVAGGADRVDGGGAAIGDGIDASASGGLEVAHRLMDFPPAPVPSPAGGPVGGAGSDPAPTDASVPAGSVPAGGASNPSAGPSGQAVPRGDLAGWRQVFVDDFEVPVSLGRFPEAVSTQWSAYPEPWRDTSGDGMYAPHQVVSVHDGVLTEHPHTIAGVPLVAAITPKIPGSKQYGATYGRYAVRFRADSIAGYKIAWMLWPDSGNRNRDGEIDFPEMNLDGANVYGYVHRTNATSGSDQAWAKSPIVLSQWHTMVLEWSPDLVVFRLDGNEIGRTSVRIPSTPMHWVLQTETALTEAGPPPIGAQGDIDIDWVAAWAYDPAAR